MARRRFFVERIANGRAVLEGEDARHLAKVLRAEIGQRYEISDDLTVHLAQIESLDKDRVCFRVLEDIPSEKPAARITLVAALIKFDRFEWLLEKATELGAAAIVPLDAERSEQGLATAACKRMERWKRIVRESSQQARRAHLPSLATPARFPGALETAAGHRYFLEEHAGAPPLLAALPGARAPSDTVALLVGPEGGWTNAERAAASAAGWRAVSLGPQILRAETAAIAALSVLTSAWLASEAR